MLFIVPKLVRILVGLVLRKSFQSAVKRTRPASKEMKEVIVHPNPDLWTDIHDVPIPTPELDEIVIKVVVAGSNVKGLFFRHF